MSPDIEFDFDFTEPEGESALLDAARRLLAVGLSIIPTTQDKLPPLRGWKCYQSRAASFEEVADWFPRHQCIAIVCGKVSGNIELIDLYYSKKRPDIFNEWRKLVEEESRELFSKLIIQTTQNSGYHCLYRCSEVQIPGNHVLARYSTGESLKTLIETRGEGGYFLADPSPGYKLRQGNFTDIPQITPSQREILLRCARLLNECATPPRSPRTSPRRESRSGLSPGDDYNRRGDIRAFLESKGWTYTGKQGDTERWRRPGKDRGNSASLLNGKTFYNFSSNAFPLEPEQSYDLFGLHTLYEHGGDFSEAARALAREGYGDSPPSQPETGGKNLEFPSWVMTGVAGDFASLYSSYLEVPAHFFFMAFLTCLGSILANSLTLASEIAPQPRLFVLLLGASADDRKSTALNKVVDFFKWSVDGFSVCWGVGSAEGLQKRLEDSNRLLLCFDEFKQFISKCKIEASVLLPCVNTLFESNRYESRTKKTDICLDDVYLSLMAASTIGTYENTWNSQFTDIGFNNRLFLVPGTGERKHSFPAKIPDQEKYLLKQRLGEILRHAGDGLELDITPEARELYHDWYMSLEKSVYTKRLDVYALRLMSLLAVNELKTEVDLDVTKKVIALCDWQFSVRALHDPIDADNAIAGMEEKIRRALKTRGSLQERKLKQYTNAARTGLWAYNTARKNLMAHGEIGFNRKEKTYFLRG
ncbi:MAG: DUF3987 domain-containing protein [Deltaproteobacteria bacterium]|nr:MAG: DUF3987 domain-containing protein [Deltaproteobacteria bacterium]